MQKYSFVFTKEVLWKMASLNVLATMFNRLSLRTCKTHFGLYSCVRQHGILAENCSGERNMNPNKLTVQNGMNSISPISLQQFQAASITSFYQIRHFSLTSALCATLEHIHEKGPVIKRKKKNPLGMNKPFAKGIILRLLVKKPKKPNSANRKCVLVRLSTGKEMIAYIPGEGHNLQEHHVVLVRVGRLRDVPGVKLKCVRGAYDLAHVVKRKPQ